MAPKRKAATKKAPVAKPPPSRSPKRKEARQASAAQRKVKQDAAWLEKQEQSRKEIERLRAELHALQRSLGEEDDDADESGQDQYLGLSRTLQPVAAHDSPPLSTARSRSACPCLPAWAFSCMGLSRPGLSRHAGSDLDPV